MGLETVTIPGVGQQEVVGLETVTIPGVGQQGMMGLETVSLKILSREDCALIAKIIWECGFLY